MGAQLSQMQEIPGQPRGNEVSLRDYWSLLKRRWWLILISFIVVVGSTIVYLVITPRQYDATAVVKLPSSGGGGGLSEALSAFLPVAGGGDVATEVEIIKGRNIAEKVAKTLKLDKKEENLGVDWKQIVSNFQGSLRVAQKGRTSLIDVTATGSSPEETAVIANAVAEEYVQFSGASRQKVWNDLISQMEKKLKQVKADLEKSRNSLHKYEMGDGIAMAYSPLLLGGSTSLGGSTASDAARAAADLKTDIMTREVQLEAMLKTVSETDANVVSLKNQIAAAKLRLEQEQKKAVENYNKAYGLTNIAAEVVFNQQLYSSLVSKQEELKAQYMMQRTPAEIIESAIEPLYPSKPKRKVTLMLGGVLGIFLGVGSAFFLEYMDKSMRTAVDVSRYTGLPVLGSIPRLRGDKHFSRRGKSGNNGTLISRVNPSRDGGRWVLYRESYMILQLELMAAVNKGMENGSDAHHSGLTLLVTGSFPGEGRSSVSANLAISAAQTGKKVLLVDADCRNPTQHRLMDMDIKRGLVDFLTGDEEWDHVVKSTASGNLYIVTFGEESDQSGSCSLLASSKMEAFMDLAREKFDVVIFDSPPATSEALSIGAKADGVIFVIRSGSQKDMVLQRITGIQSCGGNIIGTVLNCAVFEKERYVPHYRGRGEGNNATG